MCTGQLCVVIDWAPLTHRATALRLAVFAAAASMRYADDAVPSFVARCGGPLLPGNVLGGALRDALP